MPYYQRYKHLALEDWEDPPLPSELAAIEAELGRRLPTDFVEYLQVANGASLDYGIDVDLPSGREEVGFSSLFSTREEQTYGHFIFEIKHWRRASNMPDNVLPFADGGGGSTVFLDLRDEGKCTVVAFVHGLPEWAGGDSQDRYVEIASSFAEYVDRLHADLDELEELTLKALKNGDQVARAAIREYLDIAHPEWTQEARFESLL